VKSVKNVNRLFGADREQYLHRSDGARVGGQRHAERSGIAVRVDLRLQSVREAVVVDEDEIETTPFQT
jgi:hypothetical protein